MLTESTQNSNNVGLNNEMDESVLEPEPVDISSITDKTKSDDENCPPDFESTPRKPSHKKAAPANFYADLSVIQRKKLCIQERVLQVQEKKAEIMEKQCKMQAEKHGKEMMLLDLKMRKEQLEVYRLEREMGVSVEITDIENTTE